MSFFAAAVIYYDWFVPEEERHDSAVKRNKEALATELKLWEGYLQKVTVYSAHTHTLACSIVALLATIFLSQVGPHMAGPSFSLADAAIFPTVGTLFRYG